jgi:GMP synthase (glutamine-hydrolysing)
LSGSHRFLLFQARRPEDRVRHEEHAAFAARLGVDDADVETCDILQDDLDLSRISDVDALLVGGAGEFSVVDPIPQVRRFIGFLTAAAERGTPIFASCFGFQALVVGLGGEVVQDEEHAEVGTYALERTPAGAADPLFSELPDVFLAQLGHKDRATRLPAGVPSLAQSELAPFQAIRLPGQPVYATQFHPELTYADNRLRFERYMDEYGRLFGQEEAQRRLDAHRPGPEANTLLQRFAARFLDGAG